MAYNNDYEIEISDDSEATTATTTDVESSSFRDKPAILISKKKNQLIQVKKMLECRANKYFAHCSICKSNFSISNGGVYLINRHIEFANHKRFAEIQAKKNSRSICDFIPPSSALTKLTAAELSLVYHGVRHGYSYISQSCTVDLLKKIFNESEIGQNISCGKTKARELSVNVLAPFFTSKLIQQIAQSSFYSLSFDGSNKGTIKMFPFIINYFTIQCGIVRSALEIVEQPRETAQNIVDTLRDLLKKHNLDIQKLTSIGADNTNTNYGRNHSVFTILQLEVVNLLKGNCFCHVLSNSVKVSHQHLPVDVETYLSQLYSHFNSSSKRIAELKEYFEFVEIEYLRLLQHIKIRWLSLYNSIDRLLKVYEPLSSYFCDINNDNADAITCPPAIKIFFSSNMSKCTLYFLHQILFDIQTKNLELQRYSNLHQLLIYTESSRVCSKN
ncbi:unnamed protein product [Rotaria magnacalcarata]